MEKARARARAAVKYMTDKEKETFVLRHINNFTGFDYDDDKTLIRFTNGDGRTIYVTVALYSTRIRFDIVDIDFDHRVFYQQDLTERDSRLNKLWYYVDQKKQRTLAERSVRLFNIIRDGCIKVLEKFDKEFGANFLVIYGSLDENGRFKF